MLYHLSPIKGIEKLIPKIPECAVKGYEDLDTKRVCFSNSIEGCLSALQDKPRKYYVYTPINNDIEVYYPTVQEVKDCKITNEVWIKEMVAVKCIGMIESEDYDYTTRHNSGRGRVTFFHYPYKWISNI